MVLFTKKWGYNKGTLRRPGPSFPPPQTFRGKGRDCSHARRDITSSASMSTILFPQHKTKTTREMFFFQCLLSIYFLLLPLCLQQRQCFPSLRPHQLCVCCLPNPSGLRERRSPSAAAHRGLVQSWGEQAERWEHKQGLPPGPGHTISAALPADA